jgi:hypothetical protein
MPNNWLRGSVPLVVVGTTLVFALFGAVAASLGIRPALGSLFQHTTVSEVPLGHQIPKYPDGISLRLAMVHDVLHERYTRHGKDYFIERNRRTRLALDRQKPKAGEKPSLDYLALFDDLAVGLAQLGEHDEAVRLLRDKLRQQKDLGLRGRNLYTTYANLGTALIHGNFSKAAGGDAAARERMGEGLGFIRKSIEVNPQAHFGREVWQAVAVEFFLAAMTDPKLLLRYDMVGNRLNIPWPDRDGSMHQPQRGFMKFGSRRIADFLANPGDENRGRELRDQYIRKVGAEEGWKSAVATSHNQPVPFDEPVLGIIGMWRLSSGPNPHFALALGEIMLRVGQRYLAWCAFERAARLAEQLWFYPEIQRRFVQHCRERCGRIERSFGPAEAQQLRQRFDAELLHGQRYQKAYQQYEAERIRAGASIDDPHFYDAFYDKHGRIASPVGNADWVRYEKRKPRVLASAAFFAGLGAFIAALTLWLLTWLVRRCRSLLAADGV